jgi:hypothetical protein
MQFNRKEKEVSNSLRHQERRRSRAKQKAKENRMLGTRARTKAQEALDNLFKGKG